jgi:Flp pilus assembly protein TadD
VKRAYALPALAILFLSAVPALAQGGAVIQATPPGMAVERLNSNLTRLSRAPTDVEALLGAGMAAYELGDAQAANGFFMRADMVNPRNGRAKLGLALAALQLKQWRDAADNFEAAAQLGEPATRYLAERALAYDLTGQQDKAQRDYAAALRASPGDKDVIRGYAVSLGASGKLADAEAMLRPLLFQSDRSAWRDRVMILAMNGRTSEARRIAQTVMPRPLADSMDPYLQRMGALSPAQRVAAARYGQFPADGLRLAPVTAPSPAQLAARLPDRNDRRKKNGRSQAAPAPLQDDSRLAAAMPRGDAPPPAAQPAPAYQAPVSQAPSGRNDSRNDDPDGWTAVERAARAQQPAAAPRPAPRPAPQPVPSPTRPAARAPAPVMGPPAPPATAAPAASSQPRSLAAIMADIDVPESERQGASQAVDLAEVDRIRAERRAAAAKAAADKAKKAAAAKAKAEAAAKAKAEAEEKARLKANPARYWVQVATGRDPGALAFDLRRLRKTYSALAGVDGWTSVPLPRRPRPGPWKATCARPAATASSGRARRERSSPPCPASDPAHMSDLAPYACHPAASRGRQHAEPGGEQRGPRDAFQRDRDRIIHSISFRRLRHKTQVFVAPDGDHYRVRLTHSLEVAQIGRTIARTLGLNEDLTEALCLAHDIGHPPFGHAGEDALEAVLADHGGFDHNAHCLRTLMQLESPYPRFDGLNLSWEMLEGLAKHNGPVLSPGWAMQAVDAQFPLMLESWPSLEARSPRFPTTSPMTITISTTACAPGC